MKFTITSGNPTDEELLALQAVLKNHKAVELKPVSLAYLSYVNHYLIRSPLALGDLNNAKDCLGFTIDIAPSSIGERWVESNNCCQSCR
jgi:hypothetical protein